MMHLLHTFCVFVSVWGPFVVLSDYINCDQSNNFCDDISCGTGECTFNCTGDNTCRSDILNCNDGEDCTILAQDFRSTALAEINCPNDAACNMIGSGGDLTWRGANVSCGESITANASCNFLYYGLDDDIGFSIEIFNATKSSFAFFRRQGYVNLDLNGIDQVPQTDIYCPLNPNQLREPQNNCVIECSNEPGVPYENVCSWNLDIFAVGGLADVFINDTDNKANITLYCGENYEYSCLLSAPDTSKCFPEGTEPHECDYIGPTINPSVQPSNQPSLIPSNQPTLLPSEPSVMPTGEPSTMPSGQPSTIPTAQPTLMPTPEPVFQTTMITSSALPTVSPVDSPTKAPNDKGASTSTTILGVDDNMLLYIIIAAGLVIILFIICICLFCLHKKNKEVARALEYRNYSVDDKDKGKNKNAKLEMVSSNDPGFSSDDGLLDGANRNETGATNSVYPPVGSDLDSGDVDPLATEPAPSVAPSAVSVPSQSGYSANNQYNNQYNSQFNQYNNNQYNMMHVNSNSSLHINQMNGGMNGGMNMVPQFSDNASQYSMNNGDDMVAQEMAKQGGLDGYSQTMALANNLPQAPQNPNMMNKATPMGHSPSNSQGGGNPNTHGEGPMAGMQQGMQQGMPNTGEGDIGEADLEAIEKAVYEGMLPTGHLNNAQQENLMNAVSNELDKPDSDSDSDPLDAGTTSGGGPLSGQQNPQQAFAQGGQPPPPPPQQQQQQQQQYYMQQQRNGPPVSGFENAYDNPSQVPNSLPDLPGLPMDP